MVQTKEEKKAQTRKTAKARVRKRRERQRRKVELGLSPGRGKPRRAEGLAKNRTVRLDDDTYKLLRQEFGTLGDACFYLASGVMEFRESRGLTPPEPDSRLPETERKPKISAKDLELMVEVLEVHIRDWCDTRVEMRPYINLMTKLEKYL